MQSNIFAKTINFAKLDRGPSPLRIKIGVGKREEYIWVHPVISTQSRDEGLAVKPNYWLQPIRFQLDESNYHIEAESKVGFNV